MRSTNTRLKYVMLLVFNFLLLKVIYLRSCVCKKCKVRTFRNISAPWKIWVGATSNLKTFLRFKPSGYAYLYKRRTGLRMDGCAIYYKKDVLDLVEYIDVEFLQPNVTLLNRDNVAIIAKFAPKDNPGAEFIVATTHLLYNPRRQDVRLAQTQVLLSEIERMAYKKQADRYIY